VRTVIISVIQMEKLRLTEVKWVAQWNMVQFRF
jgi:hypothetical protein